MSTNFENIEAEILHQFDILKESIKSINELRSTLQDYDRMSEEITSLQSQVLDYKNIIEKADNSKLVIEINQVKQLLDSVIQKVEENHRFSISSSSQEEDAHNSIKNEVFEQCELMLTKEVESLRSQLLDYKNLIEKQDISHLQVEINKLKQLLDGLINKVEENHILAISRLSQEEGARNSIKTEVFDRFELQLTEAKEQHKASLESEIGKIKTKISKVQAECISKTTASLSFDRIESSILSLKEEKEASEFSMKKYEKKMSKMNRKINLMALVLFSGFLVLLGLLIRIYYMYPKLVQNFLGF